MDAVIAESAPFPSPWRTIWFSPRKTIRRIVDAQEPPSWWPVVALAALGQASAALAFDPDGSLSISRSFMPVVIGVAQTIFGVLVGPFLLAFVGSWFGGEADPSEIRQAVAWGYVPMAVAGLCWIPLALWYQGRISAPETEIPLAVVPLKLAVLVGGLWSIVTQIITLAEVQRFSILKAIASIAVVMIPVVLLGML
jgi:hypothetical protein